MYQLESRDGKIFDTTKEFIKDNNEQDIAVIPKSTDDYLKESQNINEEDLRRIVNPKHLSQDQEEFLAIHERLYHQPYKQMLKLCKQRSLPSKFLKKSFQPPICPSCMFET